MTHSTPEGYTVGSVTVRIASPDVLRVTLGEIGASYIALGIQNIHSGELTRSGNLKILYIPVK